MPENKNETNGDADNVDKQLKKLEEIQKRKQVCPYCSLLIEPVWVHSHYQCPNCKNVIVSCCGDS